MKGIVVFMLMVFMTVGFGEMNFRYYKIASPGGAKYGQTTVVDVDKDGDLDFISGQRSGNIYWFEYKAADSWTRHTLSSSSPTDVGGCAFDVDGDGWIDQCSGSAWYKNTGNPRSQSFTKYSNGALSGHDDMAADIDGDGKLDLIAMSESGVFWYKIPANPTGTWTKTQIGPGVHGGVDPRAAGDIDGDGDNDVVRTNMWFENRDGKGTSWAQHSNINFGQNASAYPYMTKAWITDMDGDGDNDIVETEGDLASGRVAVFLNSDGKGGSWTRIMVDNGTGQDLHSLCVADFDNDGDLDIFSGGGPMTSGTHKCFVWENLDGKAGSWKEYEVDSGHRCHEAMCGDVDGDGDIDICSKPWNGDLHFYLENQSNPGGAIIIPSQKPQTGFNVNIVPNPFRLSTTIKVSGPNFNAQPITLQIFDPKGSLVKVMNNIPSQPVFVINAADFTPGIYVADIRVKNVSATKKLHVLK